MKPIVTIFLLLGGTVCYGQLKPNPRVVGDCNATATGKNISVTVNCATGLSKADAQMFAQQFELILSNINKTNNTTALILSKLNLLNKRPTQVNNTASAQNGIANVGGTIINSPVSVYGVTKPPPQITWEQRPSFVEYEDPFKSIKRGKGIPPNPPMTVEHAAVTVTLKDDFQKPAFLITCDKPCSVVGLSRPMPGSIEIANELSPPNTYLVVVNYPRTFTKDVPVFLEVSPRTEKTFRVLNVEPYLVP